MSASRDVREAAGDVLMHWINTSADIDWGDVHGALSRHWGDAPRPVAFVDAVAKEILRMHEDSERILAPVRSQLRAYVAERVAAGRKGGA